MSPSIFPVTHSQHADHETLKTRHHNAHTFQFWPCFTAVVMPGIKVSLLSATHYSTWIIFHLASRSTDGRFPCFSSALLKTSRHLTAVARLNVDLICLCWRGYYCSTPKHSSRDRHLQEEEEVQKTHFVLYCLSYICAATIIWLIVWAEYISNWLTLVKCIYLLVSLPV